MHGYARTHQAWATPQSVFCRVLGSIGPNPLPQLRRESWGRYLGCSYGPSSEVVTIWSTGRVCAWVGRPPSRHCLPDSAVCQGVRTHGPIDGMNIADVGE